MARLFRSPLVSMACLSLTIVWTSPAAGQGGAAGSHVRADDARLTNALREGVRQSPTFRDLVARLDQTSGLVHLVSSRCLTRVSEPRACLDHNIRVSGGFRFLRVNVHPSESGVTLLALIAHELQHALEILADDSIMTFEDVEKLYERIGTKRRSGTVETEAALCVQDVVLREARSR